MERGRTSEDRAVVELSKARHVEVPGPAAASLNREPAVSIDCTNLQALACPETLQLALALVYRQEPCFELSDLPQSAQTNQFRAKKSTSLLRQVSPVRRGLRCTP